MDILHINSYYSTSSFYKNLFDKQKENNVDIKVIIPVSNEFEISNKNFGIYSDVSGNYKKIDRMFYYRKQNKIINDLTNRHNVSDMYIVHTHSLFKIIYVAMKLKEFYNIPYIVTVRNTDMNIFFKYMVHLRNTGIKILNNASNIVFLSDSYREKLINTYIPYKIQKDILQKSIVIPNGIDEFWFKNKNTINTINIKKMNLLFVGDINKNKNVETIIEAIKKLKHKKYNIYFTIVGKIKDENLYKAIKKSSFISYKEPMSKEHLLEIYRASDIFIMPSKRESFGLVYAEAMSQGLPLIYSTGQGFDQQFPDGCVGFGVKSKKKNDIAAKIEKI